MRLPETLMREVKKLAAKTDRSMTAVIEEALSEMLSRRRTMESAPPARLPTDGEGGLKPGVDIDDARGLREILDREAPVDRLR